MVSTIDLKFFSPIHIRPDFSCKDKKLSGFTVLKEAQVGDKKRERVLQRTQVKS